VSCKTSFSIGPYFNFLYLLYLLYFEPLLWGSTIVHCRKQWRNGGKRV